MSEEEKQVPVEPRRWAGFEKRPTDADERPEALCPWCGVRIREVDIRFDPNQSIPTMVLVTFRCKNCQRLHGHQLAPLWYVTPVPGIEPAGFDSPQGVRDLLSNLKKPRT